MIKLMRCFVLLDVPSCVLLGGGGLVGVVPIRQAAWLAKNNEECNEKKLGGVAEGHSWSMLPDSHC